jgi:DNA-binding Lrp family transcriptional regulator
MESRSDLSPLDRRILAALQIDGRASWSAIAQALGESERTVARRGAALLAEGHVAVRGLPHPRRVRGADQYVVRARCAPGTAPVAAAALARRPESLYSYILTGSADCAAELSVPAHRVPDLIIRDLGGTPGIISSSIYPVMEYVRTMHQWRPTLLTADEQTALDIDIDPQAGHSNATRVELSNEDKVIVRALMRDGRLSYEELSRLANVSLATARRRVEHLRRSGSLLIRAIFEPALIGFGVEALLWAQASFAELDGIGGLIRQSAQVRYASVLAGEFQLLVDVVVADRGELYDYLRTSPWVARCRSVEPCLLVEALKRSGAAAHSLDRDTGLEAWQ